MMRAAYQTRIGFLGIIVACGFILLVWRLRIVQIDRHYELYGKAQKKYTSSVKSVGVRGNILDGNNIPAPNILATSQVTYDVLAIPKRMFSKKEHVIDRLSFLLKIDRSILQKRFASDKAEVVVQNKVERMLVNRLQMMKLPGLRYVESSRRIYPKNYLLCHILGFLGSEGNGVAGIEKVYEKYLRPKEGYKNFERSRPGHVVSYLDTRKALDGKNIHLTILEPIQAIVEEEMDKLMGDPNIRPKACYAIMANPRTGAIMAISQRPNFNPNDRSTMKPELYKPRFLSDIFDPGSTMKGISIAGAMDADERLSLGSRFYCENGEWHYGGYPLRDAGHYYKNLSLKEIIQKSSNIGTAKIILYSSLTKRTLYSMVKNFGFGSKTGINLGSESAGILPPEKSWSAVKYTRIPIGQGISVTPLQMVQAYGVLANEGNMRKLYIVDKITDAKTGEVEVEFKPEFKKVKVISPETAFAIVQALKTVTKKGGTATQAAIPRYEVAGKTGTAQKFVPAYKGPNGKVIPGKYSNTLHVSSFIGFVPADNPEFVLYIVVDEPQHKKPFYYGGYCAAPFFKRIAEQTLNYLNVSPKEGGE
jgi:cell division protein FtsI (penicillin-binding protein 3)